jgi:glucan phosphoethanolaminetransferase (alkaline phosphatase superfamily)
MKHKSQITVCAIALLLLLAGLLYGYQKRQKHSTAFFDYEGYNVVLISLGPLRADHMGCYGYFRNTCPNIDKLARKSIVFENNHSQCSLTLPSQMSLFTSLYPHEHKVFFPLEATNLNKKFLTLTQILKKITILPYGSAPWITYG